MHSLNTRIGKEECMKQFWKLMGNTPLIPITTESDACMVLVYDHKQYSALLEDKVCAMTQHVWLGEFIKTRGMITWLDMKTLWKTKDPMTK